MTPFLTWIDAGRMPCAVTTFLLRRITRRMITVSSPDTPSPTVGRARFLVRGDQVTGSRDEVSGSGGPGFWFPGRGFWSGSTRFLVPGTRFLVRGTRFLVPGTSSYVR